MQMGYNTDADHLGLTVHVQTEDHGLKDSKITTQVFFSGACLDSRTISYANAIDGMEEHDRDKEITRRMKAIHKHYLNLIDKGTYNEKLPIPEDAAPKAPLTKQPAPDDIDASLTTQLESVSLHQSIANGGDEEIPDIETILDIEARTWRGFEDDFNTPLADALRTALGA